MPRGGFRPGSGRPATGKNYKCMTITLSIEGAERLSAMAKEKGLTVSALISQEFHLPTCRDLPKETPMPHMMKEEDRWYSTDLSSAAEYRMAAENEKTYKVDGKKD